MKVQIIRLDSHDDRSSARDKLGWAQASRVVLVWPDQGRVLTRELDLVLLDRRARALGSQLGLVTQDPEVRENALALGIPVFDSAEDLPDSGWQQAGKRPIRTLLIRRPLVSPSEPPPPPERSASRRAFLPGKVARILFGGLAGLALLALAATVLPSAEISLAPRSRPQQAELQIVLDRDTNTPQPDGRIPALPLSTRLQGEIRLPATGQVAVPEEPARGTVEFANLTWDEVIVPEGTGVRDPTGELVRFLTVEEVSLPAERGATASVEVVAATPGSAGNLPPGAIDAIEGPLGLQVSVTNPEATSGGNDELRPSVTLADRAAALRQLTDELLQQAPARLAGDIPAGSVLAVSSLRVVQEFTRAYDGEAGEPADSLGLQLDVQVEGLAYHLSDVETAASLALLAAAPGHDSVPGSLGLIPLTEPYTDRLGMTSFQVSTQAQVYQAVDLLPFRNLIRGIAPDEAAAYLASQLELAAPPAVRLHPFWLPRLPVLATRISIEWIWEAG